MWLDPTNPVFVPGFTMPDIQQRWALVIDGAGAVHREDIALASPKGGAAVVRHERFLRDGQAEVRSSVVLSGMSAAELSVGDRQHGRVGMDQLLCRHFASENPRPALRRESVISSWLPRTASTPSWST